MGSTDEDLAQVETTAEAVKLPPVRAENKHGLYAANGRVLK